MVVNALTPLVAAPRPNKPPPVVAPNPRVAGIAELANAAGANAAGKNFSSNTGEGVFPSQVASSPTFAPKLVASSNIGPPIRQNSTQILNMGGNGGSNQTSNSSQGGSRELSFSSTSGNGSLLSEGVFGLANA